MARPKKQQQLPIRTTLACIACRMRQRTIERLERILSRHVQHEEQHVFLRFQKTETDTLIYDPSHRLYQHFVKDPDVYEQITVETDVYSLVQFQQFLQELSSSTIDHDTMRFYDNWKVLFHCLDKQQSFWCSIRLEEGCGLEGEEDQDHFLFRMEKKKKFLFHFLPKPV